MENALATVAVCAAVGVSVEECAKALANYEGIYRRTQLAGKRRGVVVVDDFAHNPAEVVCAIKACQSVGKRVFAWFQPHGFGPLKFMHKELEDEVLKALRLDDVFLLSDVYYAGGTVSKDVTSEDVAKVMQEKNSNVLLFKQRDDMLPFLKAEATDGDVILIMGTRDNSLSDFAKKVLDSL
jgi:UDP-N-acetylmuramate--alanine ligase